MSWWQVAVVVIAAGVLTTVGGWAMTAGVLRLAARSSDAGTDPSPDTGTDAGTHTGAATGAETGADAPTTPRTAHGAPDDAGDGPTGARARAVLRGGTWIGLLERLAVTGSLLAGYPAGIAFVVAVKGLGRYPELREHPGSSERFVIGTLASLLWAAAVGGVGRALILG